MTDEEMISLFETKPEDLESDFSDFKGASITRCKCGRLVNVECPTYCGCGEAKLYWRTLEGKVLQLRNMTLGHLTNLTRMLGEKVDQYPQGEKRAKLEVALDLLFAEIGSRDAEIKQATSIQAALMRSLASKDPSDS